MAQDPVLLCLGCRPAAAALIHSTPSPGTSICYNCGPEKKKDFKTKLMFTKRETWKGREGGDWD